MCLYFLLQFGSGHSISSPGVLGAAGDAWLLLLLPPVGVLLELDRLRLDAFGPSMSMCRSAGRPLRLDPLMSSVLAGLGGAVKAPEFALLPLRNFLSQLASLAATAAARPRLPRPLGVLVSRSLVGESQLNLQGQNTLNPVHIQRKPTRIRFTYKFRDRYRISRGGGTNLLFGQFLPKNT